MIELPDELVAPGKWLSKQGRDDGPLVRREAPEFGIVSVRLCHVAKVQPSSLAKRSLMSPGHADRSPVPFNAMSAPTIGLALDVTVDLLPTDAGGRTQSIVSGYRPLCFIETPNGTERVFGLCWLDL